MLIHNRCFTIRSRWQAAISPKCAVRLNETGLMPPNGASAAEIRTRIEPKLPAGPNAAGSVGCKRELYGDASRLLTTATRPPARHANHTPNTMFLGRRPLRSACPGDPHSSEAMLAAVMNCLICAACSIVCPTASVMIQACG